MPGTYGTATYGTATYGTGEFPVPMTAALFDVAAEIAFEPDPFASYLHFVFNVPSGLASVWLDDTAVTDYTIQPGDYLEYDVWWDESGSNFSYDLEDAAGTWTLTGAGAIDQFGHSASVIAALPDVLVLDKWYSRKIAIPASGFGVVVTKFMFALGSNFWSGSLDVGGRIRDVRITDGAGTTRKQIWRQADQSPSPGALAAVHSVGVVGTSWLKKYEEPSWTDVTEDLLEVHTKRGRSGQPSVLARADAGGGNVILEDRRRRYDPTNIGDLANGIPNPSYEKGMEPWALASTSITTPTRTWMQGGAASGTRFVRLSGTSTSGSSSLRHEATVTGIEPYGVPVSPGQTVFARGSYRLISGGDAGTDYQIWIAWLDAAGTPLSRSLAATIAHGSMVVGNWREISGSAVAPASAAYARFEFDVNDMLNTVSITFDVDAAQLSPGVDPAGKYVDGDDPDSRWEGAEHSSATWYGAPYFDRILPMRPFRVRLRRYWETLASTGPESLWRLNDAAPTAFQAITKVKDIGSFNGGFGASAAVYTITVPAGGAAVGNRIVIFGVTTNANPVTSVTDARGNSYTIRRNGGTAPGMWLADAVVATALQAGDLITITRGSAGLSYAIAAEFSGIADFDAQAVNSGTLITASGGAITTTQAGDLVIGAFWTIVGSGTSSHSEIATPGTNYSNEPGVFTNANPGGPTSGYSLDWESKIAPAAGGETATATLSLAPTSYFGLTAAYKAALVPATAADSVGGFPGAVSGATVGAFPLLPFETDNSFSFDGGDVVDFGNIYDFDGTKPFTVQAWVFPTTVDATERRVISTEYADPTGQGWSFTFTNTAFKFTRWRDSASNVATSVGVVTPVANNLYHLVATYDGVTLRLYVNGNLVHSLASAVSIKAGATNLVVGQLPGSTGNGFIGRIYAVAVHDTALHPTTIGTLYDKGSFALYGPIFRGFIEDWVAAYSHRAAEISLPLVDAFQPLAAIDITGFRAAELAHVRIGWVLDLISYPDRGTIDTSTTTVQESSAVAGTLLDNEPALNHLQDVAEAELGLFFIDADGGPTFHNRYRRLSTSIESTGTWSANPAVGEYPYTVIVPALGSQDIRNDIRTRPQGGVTDGIATDPVSAVKFGPRSEPRVVWVQTLGEAQAQSEFLLALLAYPDTRFERLTFEPKRDTSNLFVQALEREISDRITVEWTPPPGGDQNVIDSFIEAISHDIVTRDGRWSWQVHYELSPASVQDVWILGDPLLSLLGESTVLGY